MQRRILYSLTVFVLFFGANIFVGHIQSQSEPFSLRQMLNAVSAVKEGRVSQSRIINDVRKRKVDFQLTPENEQLLRDEGATDEIIDTIRQNPLILRKGKKGGNPQKNTKTPTPPQTLKEKVGQKSKEVTGDTRDRRLNVPRPTENSNPKNFKNSIGMEFVRIPSGTFLMGSPTSEEGSTDDERPQHRVIISRDFYMGKYEVTQEQWKAVMGSVPTSCYDSKYDVAGDNKPVVCISWEDAQEFILKLNARGNGIYRLPTEAEWEYATRGGTTTRYYWGDKAEDVCRYANVADQTAQSKYSDWAVINCRDGYEATSPVGSFEANTFGLYDMSGNVWEWCADKYEAYSSSVQTDPMATLGSFRVKRGGSWSYDVVGLRSANRHYDKPSFRSYSIGFRLIRE